MTQTSSSSASTTSSRQPVLEARGLVKTFGHVVGLAGVDLDLYPGEVLAVIGSLIGALIVQVFDNGLALAGVDPNYQVLAVGVLVIAAVAADQWIRSVKS